MPFNFLILPLIGGFLFLTRFKATEFFTSRQGRERLIFYSAFVGFLLLVAERGIEYLLEPRCPAFIEFVNSFALTKNALSPVLALLLGVVLPWPLNRISSWNRIIRKRIEKHGNDLEKLVYESVEAKEVIMLTMQDGKVYVGTVESISPMERNNLQHIRLVPVASGYRVPDTRKVVFTDYYTDALRALRTKSSSTHWDLNDFLKILPTDRVISASYFDANAYLTFQKGKAKVETQQSPDHSE